MIAWDALKQHLLSTLGMRTATGALRSFKAAQLPFLALKALRERCRGFQRSRCSSISEVAVTDLPSHLGNAFAKIRDPARFAAPTADLNQEKPCYSTDGGTLSLFSSPPRGL